MLCIILGILAQYVHIRLKMFHVSLKMRSTIIMLVTVSPPGFNGTYCELDINEVSSEGGH